MSRCIHVATRKGLLCFEPEGDGWRLALHQQTPV